MASIRHRVLPGPGDNAHRWDVRWRENGREQTATLADESQALTLRRLVNEAGQRRPDDATLRANGLAVLAREPVTVTADRVLFVDYLYAYVDGLERPDPITKQKYRSVVRKHLAGFFAGVPLSAVDRDLLRRWQRYMMADKPAGLGLSVKTLHNTRSGVVAPALTKATQVGDHNEPPLLAHNPLHGLDLPKGVRRQRDQVSDPEHLRTMLVVAYGIHEQAADFLVVASGSGLRWGELAGLTPASLVGGCIDVRWVITRDLSGPYVRREGPKTDAGYRRVPLASGLEAILRRRAAGLRRDDLLFPGVNGGPWSYPSYHHWLKKIREGCQAAGVPLHLTTHGQRGALLTLLAEGGIDPKSLQVLAGHAHPGITLGIYARHSGRTNEQVRRVVDQAIDLTNVLPLRRRGVA